MKTLPSLTGLLILSCMLSACGSEEKTTVIHERPVVIAPAYRGADVNDVETQCMNGYDNRTRRCY